MNKPPRFDMPEAYDGYLFTPEDESEDDFDFNEVAKLACELLGIEQPKPDEPFRWPEKTPEVE